MVDRNTNLLEAFRTQGEQKRLEEPKALSSGIVQPVVGKKKKAKNALIKLYVNGALLLISAALVFVAYRLAVLPEIFPPETSNQKTETTTNSNIAPFDFQGAGTYANNFAFHWISGDLPMASKYLAVGYQFPENVATLKRQIVDWNLVWDVNVKSDKEIQIVIQAGVKATAQDQARSVYLYVPLTREPGGKYGVTGIPIYLPFPGKASYQATSKTEAHVSQPDSEAINKNVQLFLTEFYGGAPEKIGVYFADQKPRNTLKTGQLVQIRDTKLYEVQKDNPNKVMIEASVDAKVDGMQMLQSFKIYMTKNSNRWYIEKTEPYIPLYVSKTDGGA
ncbi:Conjugative transposon protein TcpC [Seinonella peptonophila]|uniref:Conjugative transposon protein TcpC n=1 Tax=Seinonella peptonophila TaxID=112248 RepID=A0A1M4XTL5_9BACL|nr:conjugal transfer protein [Seinonella peptonophila]SHE96917.1 Conjugative transposon protein TcpC [Seinonella peptonophila]